MKSARLISRRSYSTASSVRPPESREPSRHKIVPGDDVPAAMEPCLHYHDTTRAGGGGWARRAILRVRHRAPFTFLAAVANTGRPWQTGASDRRRLQDPGGCFLPAFSTCPSRRKLDRGGVTYARDRNGEPDPGAGAARKGHRGGRGGGRESEEVGEVP